MIEIVNQIVYNRNRSRLRGNPNTVRGMHAIPPAIQCCAIPVCLSCDTHGGRRSGAAFRGVAIQHDVTERGRRRSAAPNLSAATFGPQGRSSAGGPDGSFEIRPGTGWR